MFWGTGPALGFLTFIGYAVFVIGSAIVWRDRADVSVWIHDEVGAARRRFSRYTVIGPFYGIREESRFKAVPGSFLRSLRRIPRSRISGGVVLVFLGSLLVLLDFFI